MIKLMTHDSQKNYLLKKTKD